MKMMFDTVENICDKFIEVIDKQLMSSKAIEMKSMAARYTSDVIGNVAFGLDCKCMKIFF